MILRSMPPRSRRNDSQDAAVREVALQAELLALNFALESNGSEGAGDALQQLSREIREALSTASRPGPRLQILP